MKIPFRSYMYVVAYYIVFAMRIESTDSGKKQNDSDAVLLLNVAMHDLNKSDFT